MVLNYLWFYCCERRAIFTKILRIVGVLLRSVCFMTLSPDKSQGSKFFESTMCES